MVFVVCGFLILCLFCVSDGVCKVMGVCVVGHVCVKIHGCSGGSVLMCWLVFDLVDAWGACGVFWRDLAWSEVAVF